MSIQLSLYFLGTMDSVFGTDKASQDRIRAGEANMEAYNKKVTAAGDAKSGAADSPGFFGPSYNFADELRSPKEIGVRSDGSPDGISKAVAGIGYYSDVMGFGEATGINKSVNGNNMAPMGIRYFMPTGATCSNGALMWEYVDSIPKGNLLGNRVKQALSDMGLPGMRGLAPGIMEDARDALNPVPIFRAAMGSGYPKCKQVTLPVGDGYGNVKSPYDGSVWIKGRIDPGPTQTKWVQDTDQNGNPIFMDQTDFMNDSKKFYPDGSPIEGFEDVFWEKYIDKKTMAGLLFAGLVFASIMFSKHRK